MTFLTFAIVAASSLSWATFDLARKRLSGRLEAVPVVIALMLGQLPVFLAFGGAIGFGETNQPEAFFWPALLSILLNVAANVLFLRAVHLAPLSVAIPMLSFTPVFGAFGGYLLLGEELTVRQCIGVALIIVGALILQVGTASHVASDEKTRQRNGVALMLGVALLWSVTPVIDKIGLRASGIALYASIQCLGIALALWVWLWIRGRSFPWRDLKAARYDLTLAILVAAAALITQFLAIRETPIALFEAMKRAIGLVAALTCGAWFFNESVTLKKVLGLIAMGCGIAAVLA